MSAANLFAFGLGIATTNAADEELEVFYPLPARDLGAGAAGVVRDAFRERGARTTAQAAADLGRRLADEGAEGLAAAARALAETDRPLIAVVLERDDAIRSTAEAYLKLHLLSHRLALPNTLDLDGIFKALPNVAWTSRGPLAAAEINAALLDARRRGETLTVHAVDKFPRMVDYVVPSGVRIADGSRIRLGAYLGEGTTVMHEGHVNFNAGTRGPNMIEGRVTQGVVVGEHSDLGGSASIMGTLSGGGSIRVSTGRHCLIGANGGTGIPLGDRCTIEAGLYVTAGTLVEVLSADRTAVRTVKARELAGQSDLLFIRNSTTGRVECRSNRSAIELNEELHAHN